VNRPPALEVNGLTVRIADRDILTGIDLSVASGETVAVLGPSGSGKSSLLATFAGLFIPYLDGIRMAGELVASPLTQLPPERRSIGFVFQSYALWPHLSARDTVAFPWRVAGVEPEEARRRADALLESLGIAELAERLPAEMSGGQQQRVGVARALAREADLFLLDEPTAHLDAVTRRRRGEIAAAPQPSPPPSTPPTIQPRLSVPPTAWCCCAPGRSCSKVRRWRSMRSPATSGRPGSPVRCRC
jgi:ABC-type sugar transport system ATPase subunit